MTCCDITLNSNSKSKNKKIKMRKEISTIFNSDKKSVIVIRQESVDRL